jgi:hypothetical protein
MNEVSVRNVNDPMPTRQGDIGTITRRNGGHVAHGNGQRNDSIWRPPHVSGAGAYVPSVCRSSVILDQSYFGQLRCPNCVHIFASSWCWKGGFQ